MCKQSLLKCIFYMIILSTFSTHILHKQKLFHDHFTGCSPMELWNQPGNTTFLIESSFRNDTSQYPTCVDGSIGSIDFKDMRLNTFTVAYYDGTTTGSRACFVCDENNGFDLNTTTINVRVCQSDATWSGVPMMCGMLCTSIDIASTCTYGQMQ